YCLNLLTTFSSFVRAINFHCNGGMTLHLINSALATLSQFVCEDNAAPVLRAYLSGGHSERLEFTRRQKQSLVVVCTFTDRWTVKETLEVTRKASIFPDGTPSQRDKHLVENGGKRRFCRKL